MRAVQLTATAEPERDIPIYFQATPVQMKRTSLNISQSKHLANLVPFFKLNGQPQPIRQAESHHSTASRATRLRLPRAGGPVASYDPIHSCNLFVLLHNHNLFVLLHDLFNLFAIAQSLLLHNLFVLLHNHNLALIANVISAVTRNPDSVDRYTFRFHHILKEMSLSDNRHCIFLPWHLIRKVQPRQYVRALCAHMLARAA